MIENITDGAISDIDVDEDGGFKIESKDGELSIGSAEWDKSKVHGLDAPKAKIDSCIDTEEGTMYTFSELKETDAEKYVNGIKEAGFTYNSVILQDYNYTGANKDGLTVSFMYDKESLSGTIVSGKGEVPSEEDNNNSAVFGITKEWNSDDMGGLPDPGAVITSYSLADGSSTYTFEKLDDAKGYTEKIKEAGFNVDATTSEFDNTYIFTAANNNGDQIYFMSSDEGGSVSLTKAE
jgi:hypothetical protein